MKLYLINAKMKIGNDYSDDFYLTLEGDDPSAESGDWSASGPAAPFLNSQDGTWYIQTYITDEGEKITPYLNFMDGPQWDAWHFWRSVPDYVLHLDLPDGFPRISSEVHIGTVNWKGKRLYVDIIWRLARRFF